MKTSTILSLNSSILPHLIHPTPVLWCDATLAGMLTHNNHTSNAACVAYLHLLWENLRLEEPPPRGWWHMTFLSFFKPLEGETNLVSRNPRYPYHGPAWAFIEDQLRKALIENLSILEACNRFYSGAYLLETIPCVLYILEQSSHDPQNAIIRSVNDTRDNDTIASIVGTVLGALYGVKGFPKKWIEGLLGRTRTDDDHRVFDLIQEACCAFWGD